MILSSVLFAAGAHAAARVRYNNQLDHATVQEYGAEHLGAIDMSKFLMSWNATMGPPPRGWYKAEFFMENQQNNNEIIKKSGDDAQTKGSFDFDEYPKEHYCRFRIDDTGENDECCDSEDQNCYTKAGCYCDTACFTIYGDCCTDHFVTCYDDLRLCLKKVKPEAQADDSGVPNLPGNHQGQSPKQRVHEMQHDFVAPNPVHVEPNACCGQEEYNDSQKCCLTEDKRRRLGSVEKGECETEEESGTDERTSSPEPSFESDEPLYDTEEE